jgi:hypothetical protein
MNKKLLILIATLLVILPVVASCGRTSTTGNTKLPADKIPHVVDVRFENCMACHVADQLAAAKPLPHIGMNYTNKDCISVACHALSSGATTTPPPTTTTTTPPTSPTNTGTSTGTTTGTATTSTTPTGKVLGAVALKLVASSHPAAYDTLCLMCHGVGVGIQQYPVAPTWPGTPVSPGPWIVTAGSPADHTNRTDVAICLTQAGCHTR